MIETLTMDYLAGLIDGEGSLGIYADQTRMTISNLNVEILLLVKRTVGTGRIAQKSHGDCWEYQLGSLGLRALLPELIPHLIIKRRLAELVLEYLEPIPTRYKIKVTPKELARRERIRGQVCAINKSRGRLTHGTVRGV